MDEDGIITVDLLCSKDLLEHLQTQKSLQQHLTEAFFSSNKLRMCVEVDLKKRVDSYYKWDEPIVGILNG